MRAAIVIPAFNEARTVREVAARALAVLPRVIVVDDGSTDGTTEALAGLPVEVLRHPVNAGKAAALWTGFAAAVADDLDVVVTLDADGQHRPEDAVRLLAVAQARPGCIVIGARRRRRSAAPFARRLANGVADFCVSWLAGHPVADSQSGERAYPAAFLRAILAADGLRHDAAASFTLESELLIDAAGRGFCTVAIPIDTLYEEGRRASHFRPASDIARIGRMLLRHLVRSRMHPIGLWRALTQRPVIVDGTARPADRGAETLRPGVSRNA